jgi:hypothetical protein
MLNGIPDHIRIGRAKWYAWFRKTLEDKMIDEGKLAKRIKVTRATIYNAKTERNYPKRHVIDKINEALGGEIPYFHYQQKHTYMIKSNTLSE